MEIQRKVTSHLGKSKQENVSVGKQNFNREKWERGAISLYRENEAVSRAGCVQRDIIPRLLAIVERKL